MSKIIWILLLLTVSSNVSCAEFRSLATSLQAMIAEQISLIEATNLQWQTLNDLGLNDNESKPVSALDECKTRYLIPHNTSLTLANEQLRFVGWLNLANRQIGFIELNQTTHIIEPKKLLNISNTTWQIDGWNAMELSLSPICNNGQ